MNYILGQSEQAHNPFVPCFPAWGNLSPTSLCLELVV